MFYAGCSTESAPGALGQFGIDGIKADKSTKRSGVHPRATCMTNPSQQVVAAKGICKKLKAKGDYFAWFECAVREGKFGRLPCKRRQGMPRGRVMR